MGENINILIRNQPKQKNLNQQNESGKMKIIDYDTNSPEKNM